MGSSAKVKNHINIKINLAKEKKPRRRAPPRKKAQSFFPSANGGGQTSSLPPMRIIQEYIPTPQLALPPPVHTHSAVPLITQGVPIPRIETPEPTPSSSHEEYTPSPQRADQFDGMNVAELKAYIKSKGGVVGKKNRAALLVEARRL